MGTRIRKVRDLLRKANGGSVHIRAYEGAGTGGDGHGREHQADLPDLCKGEDQEGSSDYGQGQIPKIVIFGPKDRQSTATLREEVKVEEETERTSSPKRRMIMNKSDLRHALDSTTAAFAIIDETYGFADLLKKTKDFATIRLGYEVDDRTVAIIMASFADAKYSILPERMEAYRESAMWMAVVANSLDDKGNQMPRIHKSLEAAMLGMTSQTDEETGDE